jgi:hypothetical protein
MRRIGSGVFERFLGFDERFGKVAWGLWGVDFEG